MRAVLVVALWVLALTACDPGAAVDRTATNAALEAQRADVRSLVATLASGAASALGGRVDTATGHWEGCESVFPEGHRSFRYRASARIDAGPAAARPYLDALAPALGELAVTSGERPGGRVLGATVGDVELRFSELPGEGDYVLLDASGPCLEVPADQRREWEGRPDPEPIVP